MSGCLFACQTLELSTLPGYRVKAAFHSGLTLVGTLLPNGLFQHGKSKGLTPGQDY